MNPDAIRLGPIDRDFEGKLCRRQERDEAEERRREKERQRIASASAPFAINEEIGKGSAAVGDKTGANVIDHTNEQSSDQSDDDEGDYDCDDDDDVSYVPSTVGHRRVRDKIAKLEINADEYRKKFSLQADHRKLSSRGRCDVVSEQVVSGGGSLHQLPCSKNTMIRYCC